MIEANAYKFQFMPLHCSLIPKAMPLPDFEIYGSARITAEPDETSRNGDNLLSKLQISVNDPPNS